MSTTLPPSSSPQSVLQPNIVSVVVATPVAGCFDYLLPPHSTAVVGSVVMVPFGNRRLPGIVMGSGVGDVAMEKLRSLDDIGKDGMGLVEEICSIYRNYGYATEVLVASVRSSQHVVDAALIGADVVTLPPKILTSLYNHPLTDSGLDAFLQDWAKTGQSIL